MNNTPTMQNTVIHEIPNSADEKEPAIAERRSFLLKHNIALWDVLSSCEILGAQDSSIQNAVPNDFTELLRGWRFFCVFYFLGNFDLIIKLFALAVTKAVTGKLRNNTPFPRKISPEKWGVVRVEWGLPYAEQQVTVTGEWPQFFWGDCLKLIG